MKSREDARSRRATHRAPSGDSSAARADDYRFDHQHEERDDQRGLDERATRRGAKRLRGPRAGVRRDECSLGVQAVAQLIRGVAIEHRLIGRRIDDQCANASVGASEEVRSGARRHVERLTERRCADRSTTSIASAQRGRGSCAPGSALITAPGSPTNRSVSTVPSHGTNIARTGRFVASGESADPTRTYFGPATIHASRPTTASVSADGARLRDEIVARAHGDSVETGAANGGLNCPSRTVSPRNSRSLEGAIRRAQPHGIERRRDQRGHRRQLVGRRRR